MEGRLQRDVDVVVTLDPVWKRIFKTLLDFVFEKILRLVIRNSASSFLKPFFFFAVKGDLKVS